ncbi:MAG: redox-regulated ATPase YchF [Firmicutes bacterium]|nr:redox-regulated ATPase YchF [Bacillota bacterium]
MGWSCGLVGLPNAGKSTIFKAITAHDVTIASYPFSTVDPNKAIVSPEDLRLISLAAACGSKKMTPATIEIIDVAGLVKGASRGEGLGNQFLGHLRNVDLLIHVVALFDREQGGFDNQAEKIEIINLELALADLETIRRRREKTEPKLKSGDQGARFELETLVMMERYLNEGMPLRNLTFTPEEKIIVEQLSLLTGKTMLYVYNHEDDFNDGDPLTFFGDQTYLALCGRLEAELIDLQPGERSQYLEAFGMKESRITMLLQRCFDLLQLLTFYTVKGDEAKAWVVPRGTKVVKAAGKIHTEMEKGFINVEVISWEQLAFTGSLTAVRDRGLSRTEGKDYQVQDGDVLFVRFRS